MASIKDIEGVGKAQAEKLAEAGIRTTEKLLEVGGTKKARTQLAKDTGISEKLVLEWVNLADLFRIKGIGEEFSDLLEEAGVDSVVELATRSASNLHKKLHEINEVKKLVRQLPSESQVEDFIAQAGKLERAVHH